MSMFDLYSRIIGSVLYGFAIEKGFLEIVNHIGDNINGAVADFDLRHCDKEVLMLCSAYDTLPFMKYIPLC